jgi:hypothetical protein
MSSEPRVGSLVETKLALRIGSRWPKRQWRNAAKRWREERAKLSQGGDLSTSPRGGQGGGSSNDRRGGPQVEMKLA